MKFSEGQAVYMRCRVVGYDGERVIVTPLDESKQAKDGVWCYVPEHALLKVSEILKVVKK